MLLLTHRVIYAAGEPFARFESTLKAALWLRSVGYRMKGRVGCWMVFEAVNPIN